MVHATGPQGSAILRPMSEADCFIVLPHDWGPGRARHPGRCPAVLRDSVNARSAWCFVLPPSGCRYPAPPASSQNTRPISGPR
ncbi:MAG: hypothetical protein H0U97_19695 [Gammaproteobacteria bacterium]|nr:hypothetical protein [Gammaproteobacteria bacterium]